MTDVSTAPSDPGIDLTPGADADANARLLTSIIYGLYLAGFISGGLTAIAGVIMAYVVKGGAPAWAQSHYTFQIWTFWIGLVLMLVMIPFIIAWVVTGAVLSIVGVGILMLIATVFVAAAPFIWFAARCAVGLSYAVQTQPYPRPQTLLV
ncbi:MAG TPA: hypothetical protein VF699_09205 [Caulobacteraceae bacterium]|jgi:uncharacterized membrane protein